MSATSPGVVDDAKTIDDLKSTRTAIVLFATFATIAALALVATQQFTAEAQRAPRLAGIAVLLLAVLGLVRYSLQLFAGRTQHPPMRALIRPVEFIGANTQTVGLVALYVLALRPLGFIVASMLFLGVLAAVLRDGRDLIADAIFGVAAALAVWAVFVPLLGVRLPRATLF